MSTVVQLVQALAWPVAAVILLLVFRSSIRELMERVKKVDAGPFKMELEHAVTRVEAAAHRVEEAAGRLNLSGVGTLELSGRPGPARAAPGNEGEATP